jgi:hypothetical protein
MHRAVRMRTGVLTRIGKNRIITGKSLVRYGPQNRIRKVGRDPGHTNNRGARRCQTEKGNDATTPIGSNEPGTPAIAPFALPVVSVPNCSRLLQQWHARQPLDRPHGGQLRSLVCPFHIFVCGRPVLSNVLELLVFGWHSLHDRVTSASPHRP